MPHTVTASFEITGWDETRYDEPAEGPPLARATEQHAFGNIVPGSGTGELRGLRGEAAFAHDDAGARLMLTFILPDD